MDRRVFLSVLFSAWLGLGALATPAHAKDGGEGKGGDGGESDGGESEGSDGESDSDSDSDSGSESGSGSDGSDGKGSGSGSGSESGNGKGSGKSGSGESESESESETETEHEEATEAVRKGEVLSYRDILGRLKRDRIGRVLKVELDRSSRGPVYRMRVEDQDGIVSTLVVDARTGRLMGRKER